MDNSSANPQEQAPPQQSQKNTSPEAVPYTPQTTTPPVQQQSRSPMVNAAVFAGIILVGGFITYNVVGRSLTQLAGQSTAPAAQAIVTPTPMGPTVSPTINTTTPVDQQTNTLDKDMQNIDSSVNSIDQGLQDQQENLNP